MVSDEYRENIEKNNMVILNAMFISMYNIISLDCNAVSNKYETLGSCIFVISSSKYKGR